jgi:hypothetical protein
VKCKLGAEEPYASIHMRSTKKHRNNEFGRILAGDRYEAARSRELAIRKLQGNVRSTHKVLSDHL